MDQEVMDVDDTKEEEAKAESLPQQQPAPILESPLKKGFLVDPPVNGGKGDLVQHVETNGQPEALQNGVSSAEENNKPITTTTNQPTEVNGDSMDDQLVTPPKDDKRKRHSSLSQRELKNLSEDLTEKVLKPIHDESASKSRFGRVHKLSGLVPTPSKKRHPSMTSNDSSGVNAPTPKATKSPAVTPRTKSASNDIWTVTAISSPPPRRIVIFNEGTIITKTRQELLTIPPKADGAEFCVSDIVFVKHATFPFWPCLITIDPTNGLYAKRDKEEEYVYHVQFLGDEASRTWTKPKNVFRFEGVTSYKELFEATKADLASAVSSPSTSKKGHSRKLAPNKYAIDPKHQRNWKVAVAEAEFAMKMSPESRLEVFNFEYRVRTPEDVIQASGKKRKLGPDTPTVSKKIKKVKKNQSSPEDVYDFDEFDADEAPVVVGTPLKLLSAKKKGDFDVYKKREMKSVRNNEPNLNDEQLVALLKRRWDDMPDDQRAIYVERGTNGITSAKKTTTKRRSKKPEIDDGENDPFDPNDDSFLMKPLTRTMGVGKITPVKPITPASLRAKRPEKPATPVTPTVAVEPSKEIRRSGLRSAQSTPTKSEPTPSDTKATPTNAKASPAKTKTTQSATSVPVVTKTSPTVKKPTVLEASAKKKLLVDSPSSSQESPLVPSRPVRPKSIPTTVTSEQSQTSDESLKSGETTPIEVSSESEIMSQSGDSEAGDHCHLPRGLTEVACFACFEKIESEEDKPDQPVEVINCSGVCKRTFHKNCLSKVGPVADDGASFTCTQCSTGQHPCFVCGKVETTSSDGESQKPVKCGDDSCGRFYHINCLTISYPHKMSENSTELLSCPLHTCLTCHIEHQEDKVYRTVRRPLLSCVLCPTSFHFSDDCLAAGSMVIAAGKLIICPEHAEKKNRDKVINVGFCFACMKGGDLVCCERCPAAFHSECLEYPVPDGPFTCSSCTMRKQLKYGDIVWVKYGSFRWWPAKILHPMKTPDNIMAQSWKKGQFPIMFYGPTIEHAWVDRSRVFPYVEDDTVIAKSKGDKKFRVALEKVKEDFQQYKKERSMALNRKAKKPPPYNRIHANKAIGGVKLKDPQSHDSDQKCECDPTSDDPCSSDTDCHNRSMRYECNDRNCSVGSEKCRNRRFQKRQYVKTKLYNTIDKGWALRTVEDIKEEQFVIEYVGEIIDEKECERRLQEKVAKGDGRFYFLTIDRDRIIDAGPSGNLARFMNHSCNSNCQTRKWTVNGQTRIGLFAVRDIPAGTELTFNYNLETRGDEKTACHCGEAICSGFIGVRLPKAVATNGQSTKKTKTKGGSSRRSSHDEAGHSSFDPGNQLL